MTNTRREQLSLKYAKKFKRTDLIVVECTVFKGNFIIVVAGDVEETLRIASDFIKYQLKVLTKEVDPTIIWKIVAYFKERNTKIKIEPNMGFVNNILFGIFSVISKLVYQYENHVKIDMLGGRYA